MSFRASRLTPQQISWFRGLMPFAFGAALAGFAGFLLYWVPLYPRLDVYALALAAIGAGLCRVSVG